MPQELITPLHVSDDFVASLTTEAPLGTRVFQLTRSPYVVGRGRDADANLDHPNVAAEHVVLVRRSDGWWVAAQRAPIRINGAETVGESQKLERGDRLELSVGAALRFDDGSPEKVDDTPRPRPLRAAPKRRRWRFPQWNVAPRSLLVPASILFALALIGTFSWVAWRTVKSRPVDTAPLLTEADGILFDSLFTVTLDHIERGNVLLENGASQAALGEFGAGLATLSTSSLRKNSYVIERLEELRTSIGDVYRSRRVTVPQSFVARRGSKPLRGQGLSSALSVEDFASALTAITSQFSSQFGKSIIITGRDHAEHVSLYGEGGAVDVRVRDLRPDEVSFLVNTAKQAGIRVKDFSRDDVLRAQIAAAMKAGLADRASTGLHLHLDRFVDRMDRWTVR